MALLTFLAQYVYKQLSDTALLQSNNLLQTYLDLIQQEPIINCIQHAIDNDFSKQQLKSLAKQIFCFPIRWQQIFATQLQNYSTSLRSPPIIQPSSKHPKCNASNADLSIWRAWKSGRISPIELYECLNLAIDQGNIDETGMEHLLAFV